MNWLWLVKRFPKYALVVGLIVASTALFGFWWFFLRSHRSSGRPVDVTAQVEKMRSRFDWLIVADGDLYDAGTGEGIFKRWLKGDSPGQLFYDAAAGKILGQYEKGFARYKLDGRKEAGMFEKSGIVFSADKKTAAFVREKDVWLAGVDWQAFKLVNERKATTLGTFNEMFFSENVLLASGKVLVVRNLNQLLRINVESGVVKPVSIPLPNLAGRSPDGSFLLGDIPANRGRQLFAYDVEADKGMVFEIGRNKIGGFAWLDKDRCALLVGGQGVALYDRRKAAPEELATLPFPCNRIGEPSPDGHYVFCGSRQGGVLVDIEKKTAIPVTGGSGITWVSNDTFAVARDVQDSELRGTWLQTVGQGERRVSPEPFAVSKAGASIMRLPSTETIIFAAKGGLFRMKPDRNGMAESIKTAAIPSNVLGIQDWGLK